MASGFANTPVILVVLRHNLVGTVGMGYVGEFLDWFNAQPSGTQKIGLLLATLVLSILGWLIRRVFRAWTSPRPSLLLIEPEEWQYIRWVPLEIFGVRWSPKRDEAQSPNRGPEFRLKNLSNEPVENIQITWRISSDRSTRDMFSGSHVLRPYSPSVDADGIFFLNRELPEGASGTTSYGLTAGDKATTVLPYCAPTPSNDDYTTVEMNLVVAHGVLLRLISEPPPTHRKRMSVGPRIEVSVAYRLAGKTYKREYEVRTETVRCQDMVGGGLCGASIEDVHRWDGNFRGAVKFTVEPRP